MRATANILLRPTQSLTLRVTEGNVVDYGEVYRTVLEEVRARFKGLVQVGYDPWNANHLATSLAEAGVEMVEVRQGYASVSGPSKLFEALVRSRRLRHDGNPVMRWCVANCEVASDAARCRRAVRGGRRIWRPGAGIAPK